MFQVNQKVVAVRNHSQGYFKKGQEFIIKAINGKGCNCNHLLVNVGIKEPVKDRVVRCTTCKSAHLNTGYGWFDATNFAPIVEDEISETTYEDVMENIEKHINEPQTV